MSLIGVSPLLGFASATSQLDRLREDMEHAQLVATTGLEVAKPSDAPGEWTLIHGLSASIADQQRFSDASDLTVPILQTADSALGEAVDVLTRARELAVQAASDTLPAEQREALAMEIESLTQQLIDLANTDHAGRYVFAGTAYDAPAFDENGEYVGNQDSPSVQVGQSTWVESGYAGDDFFGEAIASLQALEMAMVDTEDPGAASAASLDQLDSALSDVTGARTPVGLSMQRALDASAGAEMLQLSLAQQLDAAIGADEVEAYTRLAETQATYEAALQVSATTLGLNLFSFMR